MKTRFDGFAPVRTDLDPLSFGVGDAHRTVALLTAAPDLLTALVELMEAAEGIDHTEHCIVMRPYRGCRCGVAELATALAAAHKLVDP